MKNVVLNRITKIHDDNTESLGVFDTERRKLVLFISHRHDLVSFGYINDNLVWFSFTKTKDLLSSRRIFDCMKVSVFYRKTELDVALSVMGMMPHDLQGMCRIDIDNIESDAPVFSGCVTADGDNISGIDFAEYMAVLPYRIAANIENIGSTDDILTELINDYNYLQALYDENESFNLVKYNKASVICNKWRSVECLHMSDRASIRNLYKNICYHDAGIERQYVANIK